MDIVQLYIYLPEKAVDVWRPVDAEKIGDNLFRIIGVDGGGVPDGEKWEFQPNDIVKCETKKFFGGETGLVPIEKVIR